METRADGQRRAIFSSRQSDFAKHGHGHLGMGVEGFAFCARRLLRFAIGDGVLLSLLPFCDRVSGSAR